MTEVTQSASGGSSEMVRERSLTVNGHKTRYLEAGDSVLPTVVLLHDGAWGGSSSTTWGTMIPKLSRQYHVIAPDMLGFGGTCKTVSLDRAPYAPRIEHVFALLDALGIGRFHVVGCSFGGSVALRMLETGRVDALTSVVSVSGTGGPWRTKRALSELAHWDGTRADIERIVRLLVRPFDGWDAHVDERFHWASEPGHYRAVMAVGTPLPAALRQDRQDDGWPTTASTVQTPVLLIAGEGDALLDPDWTTNLARALPRCDVFTANMSHEPSIDQPDLLIPVLDEFLSRAENEHRRRSSGAITQ
jgi:pimeloyl-ACP methyl ester carboxylesterase